MPRALTIEDYEITEDGRVINRHSGRILKGQPNGKGYLRVSIGGQLRFIHRMVAEKYVPNPEGKQQVNHKDGNKLNNHAENLEWVTNQENRDHAMDSKLHLQGEQCSWAKLTERDVQAIRKLYGKVSNKELAEIYGVSISAISAVQNHRSWKNS